MTGKWPAWEVDHINGIKTDNRWPNLREATGSQNQGNRKLTKANKTGFKGVTLYITKKGIKRWKSQLTYRLDNYYLGYFDSPEKAHAAYCEAALRLQGEFANFG